MKSNLKLGKWMTLDLLRKGTSWRNGNPSVNQRWKSYTIVTHVASFGDNNTAMKRNAAMNARHDDRKGVSVEIQLLSDRFNSFVLHVRLE